MKNLIESFGGELMEAYINDLREGTFFAKLTLDTQELDARPSDAIALAIRFNVPIYVAEKVMAEAAFIPEGDESDTATPPIIPKEGEDVLPHEPGDRLDQLRKQLEDAIAKEEYEKAARVRDEIKNYRINRS
jgi:hypothetical protein